MREVYDVAGFVNDPAAFPPMRGYLVVKDLTLLDRRERLKKTGPDKFCVQREDRPTERGLLVNATLRWGGRVKINRVLEFPEIRGMIQLSEGRKIVSSHRSILMIDEDGATIREYRHPSLNLVHNLTLSPLGARFLATVTGNATILEFDIETGLPTWEWLSWEHGWNPTPEGMYRTRQLKEYWRLLQEGKWAIYLQPGADGCTGTMVSSHSFSANSTCYNGDNILATIGREGKVVEIDRETKVPKAVISGLGNMPHGIMPCEQGWIVSDTRNGAVFQFDKDFTPTKCILLKNLPKPPDLDGIEWIQHAIPVSKGVFLIVDAHRGILAVDIVRKLYAVCEPDPTWSIHLIDAISTSY